MVPIKMTYGGGVCESNTPGRLFTPHDGFEDRGAHQDPSASARKDSGFRPGAPRVRRGGYAFLPRVRASPSRFVTPWESKYSSSGMMYLRLEPTMSRASLGSMEPCSLR